MTDRRSFLATLGATVGTTVLVREGIAWADPNGESVLRSQAASIRSELDPTWLRVDKTGRELTARGHTFIEDSNSIGRWHTLSGHLRRHEVTPDGDSIALRLAPNPDGTVEYVFDEPFDFTEFDLSIRGKFLEPPASPLQLRLFAPDRRNQLITRQRVFDPMAETWFGVQCGPTDEVGSPDLTTVRRIRIELPAGASPFAFNGLETTPKATTGRAMLIFDDNRASVSTAHEAMQRRGIPGAIAVIPGLDGADGYLSADQLATYHDDGWDLLSHPRLERPLPAYSRERQHAAIRRSKRRLVEQGYSEGPNHFVAPFGKVGPDTLDLLSDYHYTNYLTNNVLSGTPPADPLTIERVAIDDIEFAKRQIRRAARHNMLVVFSAHTVGNSDDRWISTDGFVKVLDYLERTDIEVVTPTDYWQSCV